MPKAVRVLQRGLFSKSAVGRGTEAGRATTAADFEELMQPITETQWNDSRRQAKKCSRPGKSKIKKPAIRHIMPNVAWDDMRQITNLADEMDQDIKQHSSAQLFLILKDPEVAALYCSTDAECCIRR
jgi:hypothetical protein